MKFFKFIVIDSGQRFLSKEDGFVLNIGKAEFFNTEDAATARSAETVDAFGLVTSVHRVTLEVSAAIVTPLLA